jgi:hypothetical protein
MVYVETRFWMIIKNPGETKTRSQRDHKFPGGIHDIQPQRGRNPR